MGVWQILFGFRGRLRRRVFWLWFAAICAIYVLAVADGGMTLPHFLAITMGKGRLVVCLAGLPFVLWMTIALWAKRFHDCNLEMFDLLRVLFPIRGWIWGVAMCMTDGTTGPNRFGPSPKGIPGVDVF